ncbi:MAG: DUF6788 family protein [Terracidiphilus sp.]
MLRQIERVKGQLAALGDLRPGSLSTQYNVCGTPGCRCKATPPEKHGPYYQVSFTRKGKSSSKFVRKEDLAAVRRELKNYETMTHLLQFAAQSVYNSLISLEAPSKSTKT